MIEQVLLVSRNIASGSKALIGVVLGQRLRVESGHELLVLARGLEKGSILLKDGASSRSQEHAALLVLLHRAAHVRAEPRLVVALSKSRGNKAGRGQLDIAAESALRGTHGVERKEVIYSITNFDSSIYLLMG